MFLEAYDRAPFDEVNPWCVACRAAMKKAGKELCFQSYACRYCRAYYRDGKRFIKLSNRERRRYTASLRWLEITEIISQALPKYLEAEIREEIEQEIMVAALNGDFNLRELPEIVRTRWRKIKRQQQDLYKFVSLDQIIPGTDSLTIGDTLAG
jgi:hypothetical protein